MTMLLLNLLLALLWMLLWGSADLCTALVGLVSGYLVLCSFTRVLRRDSAGRSYGGRVGGTLRFAAYFLWLLVKSNLVLAREILTPGFGMAPRLLRYEVTGLTDPQIVALSSAITLTPGTLVVDISRDRRFLYIHAMYAGDRAAAIRELDDLRHRMEQQVFGTPRADT